jgi:protein-disulfide isomerase
VGIDSKELALAMKNPKVRYLLNRDIILGNQLAITGTPTFVINNKIYTGHIPPEVFKDIIP